MSENWPPTKLGDCCDILDNLRVPLNSEERGDIQGNIPYYGANGLQGYIDKFIFDEPLILLAEDGGYFDEFQSRPIAYKISGKSWVNNHAHVLRAKAGSSFSQDFIFYCLEHKNITPFIKGGTRAKLNQSELREILIPKPPEPVQERIAEILLTIDEAMEQTKGLIAKYQQIKAGLMHDLFTRGITPDGQLRPTRAQAPQLYRDDPSLGWIPKEWEVTTLQTEINIDHGFAFSGVYFSDSPPGSVLLTPGNFHRDGGLYFTPDNTKYFQGVIPPETILRHGEMVTVMTDLSPQTLILGRFAIIETQFPVLHNQRVGRVSLKNKAAWDWNYLCYALNSERLRRQIIVEATGTTVRHTSPGKILSKKIGRPRSDEQLKAASIMNAVGDRLATEKVVLAKLHAQKLGLMQDLLTPRANQSRPRID